MTEQNRGVVMRINDASLELFGESNDTNRKRVRKLIDRGLLRATKLTGDGRGSPSFSAIELSSTAITSSCTSESRTCGLHIWGFGLSRTRLLRCLR